MIAANPTHQPDACPTCYRAMTPANWAIVSRRAEMLGLLQAEGAKPVDWLAKHFKVTRQTIFQDARVLKDMGLMMDRPKIWTTTPRGSFYRLGDIHLGFPPEQAAEPLGSQLAMAKLSDFMSDVETEEAQIAS